MSENVLELRNIVKTFGDFKAVNDVSFSIPQGSIYGFLGPNGAGKTTTIRIILEIIQQTSGSVAVFGHPSSLLVRERIGYLPEEKGLYKKMKTWSIIAYFATLKGLSRAEAKRRAYELLEKYGLKDVADQKTEALSKGMGQKVQVLASIAHDPDLVILDEPFSGLDPVNQEVMEEIIRDMAARGKTILFSTHVMQHAERICDHILLIAGGKKSLMAPSRKLTGRFHIGFGWRPTTMSRRSAIWQKWWKSLQLMTTAAALARSAVGPTGNFISKMRLTRNVYYKPALITMSTYGALTTLPPACMRFF